MVLKEVADVSRYGSVQLTNADIVEKFTEKDLTTSFIAMPLGQKVALSSKILLRNVHKIPQC